MSIKPLVMELPPASLLTTCIPQQFWTKLPSVAGMHRTFHRRTFAHSGLSLLSLSPLSLGSALSPVLCLATPYSYFMSPLRHCFSGKSSPLLLFSFLPMLSGSLYFQYHSSIKEPFYLPPLDCKSVRTGTMTVSFTSNSLCLAAKSQLQSQTNIC